MRLILLFSIVSAIVITGCSQNDKPAPEKEQPKPPIVKKAPEEVMGGKILTKRAIIKEQGALTDEQLDNPKNAIKSPISTDRRKRAIGMEQGGPPAPEGLDKKEAEAKRHINTK